MLSFLIVKYWNFLLLSSTFRFISNRRLSGEVEYYLSYDRISHLFSYFMLFSVFLNCITMLQFFCTYALCHCSLSISLMILLRAILIISPNFQHCHSTIKLTTEVDSHSLGKNHTLFTSYEKMGRNLGVTVRQIYKILLRDLHKRSIFQRAHYEKKKKKRSKQ